MPLGDPRYGGSAFINSASEINGADSRCRGFDARGKSAGVLQQRLLRRMFAGGIAIEDFQISASGESLRGGHADLDIRRDGRRGKLHDAMFVLLPLARRHLVEQCNWLIAHPRLIPQAGLKLEVGDVDDEVHSESNQMRVKNSKLQNPNSK